MKLSADDVESLNYNLINTITGKAIPYVAFADDKKGIYKIAIVENSRVKLRNNKIIYKRIKNKDIKLVRRRE